ncbi:radical SAM protein with 4Fe4S-binding SPASM domain [Archangium gephyra]|uniref:Radical SAM protein with 4Fe4S-binding SPASM domain n=1 Tax=Archangium gephyra TaxID=48 RepID=A0ABX9JL76_9BACT|nr:radical SAM protein [Archangium gephyra]REG20336.1 radical SAM protein with 4Fe4S-binding SPASM domain [Archangium gephyra]
MPPPVVQPRTAYAVWELTLKCNLACGHCGSRAGDTRNDELSPEEALDLVRQLAEVGIQEVTIEGGEAFLRPDWLEIARAITDAGMRCTMTTGGYGLSRETARKMKDAGIAHVSVSVDGLEATHDRIRGKPRSFFFCFQTLGHFREVGLPFSANTQINRLSAPELPALYERLRDAGIRGWQVQLTSAMGNGGDNAWMLLQPAELPDFYRMLARVALRARDESRVALTPANDIGYFGPYDDLLFASVGKLWAGCKAGLSVLGIHADGGIKGCPTLPSEYVGGNIRKQPLADILESRELTFNVDAGTEKGTAHMWGYCGSCKYAAACRGGCSQQAHVLFDKRGNNPFCHYRSLELAGRGLRERIVPGKPGPGRPFDHGVFDLLVEPVDAPWPADDTHRFSYERVQWPAGWEAFPLPEPKAQSEARAAVGT